MNFTILAFVLFCAAGGVSSRFACVDFFGYHCVHCPPWLGWCRWRTTYHSWWSCHLHCPPHETTTTTATITTSNPSTLTSVATSRLTTSEPATSASTTETPTTATSEATPKPTTSEAATSISTTETVTTTTSETATTPTTSASTPTEATSSTTSTGTTATTTLPLPPAWHDAALFLEQMTNISKDPCADFYEFSCGGDFYSKETDFTIYRLVDEGNFKQAAKNVESGANLPEKLWQVRDLILECTREEERSYAAYRKAPFLFSETPKLNEFAEAMNLTVTTKSEIALSYVLELVANLSKNGIDTLYRIGFAPNVNDDGTKYGLHITQPSLLFGFPPEYWLRPEIADDEAGGRLVAATVGLDWDKVGAEPRRLARAASKVARILASLEEKSSARSQVYRQYYPYTVERANALLPYLNITEYIQDFQDGNSTENASDVCCVTIGEVKFFKRLLNFTSSLTNVTTEELFIYVQIKAATDFWLDHKPPANFTLDTCLRLFHQANPFAVGRFYQNKLSMESYDDIYIRIRGAVLNQIDTLPADDKTKSQMKNKFYNTEVCLSQPEGYDNDIEYNRIMGELNTTGLDWIEGLYSLKAYDHRMKMRKVGQAVYRQYDTFSPLEFGPRYSYKLNSVTVPSGMVVRPFYYPEDGPGFVNFATTGSVLANTFAKAFDENGVQFDAGINSVTLSPIYDKLSLENLTKSLSCLSSQFGSYCHQNVCTNGDLQASSNYADALGLAMAFQAYKAYVHDEGEERRLPGELSKFDPIQLFFINYAKNFCGNRRFSTLDNKVSMTSENRYRVNGATTNFQPFLDSFKCNRNPIC